MCRRVTRENMPRGRDECRCDTRAAFSWRCVVRPVSRGHRYLRRLQDRGRVSAKARAVELRAALDGIQPNARLRMNKNERFNEIDYSSI